MATVDDVEVANASFPNVRQDLNDILEAITTNFSADTEPTTTYPNQFWYETDTNLLYIRNEADDAWITLASINQTTGEWEPRTAVIQAIDAAGLSFKTDEGTTRVEIADDGSVTVNTSLDVDNIKIDGNTISSTDTNGDINITPDGTGKVVIDGLNYPTADGSDGQVLTTDGSGNIAFEDAPSGKVLQVVTESTNTEVSVATATYTDTTLTANITPISASSTILVFVNQQLRVSRQANQQFAGIRVLRDATVIHNPVNDGTGPFDYGQVTSGATSVNLRHRASIQLEDSPNTTSQITYKTQVRPYFTTDAGRADVQESNTVNATSYITLMEIAG